MEGFAAQVVVYHVFEAIEVPLPYFGRTVAIGAFASGLPTPPSLTSFSKDLLDPALENVVLQFLWVRIHLVIAFHDIDAKNKPPAVR